MVTLITPVERAEPFDHADWLFEPKFDGFRAAANTVRGRLTSRNGNRTNRAPGERASALALRIRSGCTRCSSSRQLLQRFLGGLHSRHVLLARSLAARFGAVEARVDGAAHRQFVLEFFYLISKRYRFHFDCASAHHARPARVRIPSSQSSASVA
jgi:hypothetical protein